MMKLSFMTLGCPEWDLETICTRGREYGFTGVDFRGLQGEIDVSKTPAFTTNVAATVRLIADNGLVTSGLSTSILLCDAARRAENLDEARRTIDVAAALGAKNVRVFGGGDVKTIGQTEAARIGQDCIAQILELPGARSLSWNFETHDHWVRSSDCRLLLDAVTDLAFGATWDVAHTMRVGLETAPQTLSAIGDRLRYVQIKDARRDPGHPKVMHDGWRYVVTGEGELDIKSAVVELDEFGYDGWLVFEHEKRWQANLDEPEIAFPAFVAWAQNVLQNLPARPQK